MPPKKPPKKGGRQGDKTGSMRVSQDTLDAMHQPTVEEKELEQELERRGLVDLRKTRPALPSPSENSPKRLYETAYEELKDARELQDVAPVVLKARRVDAGALKREKEKLLYGEGGQDAAPKTGSMFSVLDKAGMDRFRAMLINFCKKEDGTFYDAIDLRQYGIDSGQLITNAVVQELCSVQPSLTKLDLTSCDLISDVGLWAIARHCPDLEHLILSGCHQITNVGLRSISLACANITALDFNNCNLLDDIGLTVLATGAWKLQRLYLQHCTGLTDTGVGKVAKMGHHLVELDLFGCTNVGEFGDHALKEIGAFCGNLKQLNLGGCKRVEDPGLRAVALGCTNLEVLKLAGCDLVTFKSLKAICQHSRALTTLHLIGCKKLTDRDFELFGSSAMTRTLTDLDLSGNAKITDRGVAAIARAFGTTLYSLSLSHAGCSDYSAHIISNMCTRIRDLDLALCQALSDETVHTLARKVSSLCTLRLDGCPRITVQALVSHIGPELEFCVMADRWLGYQPKGNVEGLIREREIFVLNTRMALKIQCALRRKFAWRRYWDRRRWHLVTRVVPKFQARLRGAFQRKRYKEVQRYIFRAKKAILIQKRWRTFKAVHWKVQKLKQILFEKYKLVMAGRIQRRYRGMVGRRIVIDERNRQATQRLVMARIVAKREIKAIIIQRTIMAFLGRAAVKRRILAREGNRQIRALHDRMTRYIQRVARGRLGRKRFARRKWEVEMAQVMWLSARKIQKSYRGLLGKRRFWWFFENRERLRQAAMATIIQKYWRRHRGKLLAGIAKSLRILRIRKSRAATVIQRIMRGIAAREGVKHYRLNVIRDKTRKVAVVVIQRIFRGHKGREASAIERELRQFEGKVKPLVELIKRLEAESLAQARYIAQIDDKVQRSEDDLFKIERELAMCMQTTSKFTDSSRINNTPQRFLTKYLRIRLKDHFEHEKELHQARFKESVKLKGACRNNDLEITAARRELLPLTTGVVIQVKRARADMLRARVRERKTKAAKIQALVRRFIVRMAWSDPVRDYWIKCYDLEQSDQPYYYNTWSNATEWKEPLAHKFFCRPRAGAKKEEVDDDDDDEIQSWHGGDDEA